MATRPPSPPDAATTVCPACGAANREGASFCKACGRALRPGAVPGASPAPARPPARPVLVPPPAGPRVWWHGLGVFTILAGFLLFIDAATTGRVTWSVAALLGLAFLLGAIMILQVLASPEPRDRRPLAAGAVLLVLSVVFLPVTLALQSGATTTDVFEVPYDPTIARLNLLATNEAGDTEVRFAPGIGYLVRVEIVHRGGLFTSHYEGDVVATNTSAGDTLSYRLTARGFVGLFFGGGHAIRVTVNDALSVDLDLQTTTGALTVDLPAGVKVRSVDATVTTGSVSLASNGTDFGTGASLRATSTTGGVTIDLREPVGGAGIVSLAGTTTTGSVTYLFRGGGGSATKVESTAATGRVSLDPTWYEGTTTLAYGPSEAAYDAASLLFDARLTTTTGSVSLV